MNHSLYLDGILKPPPFKRLPCIAVCMHDGVHPQIDAAIVSEAKPA